MSEALTREPKIYKLVRHEDVSGVSGTGLVAWATEYPNGWTTVSWVIKPECPSVVIYTSLNDAISIHGHNGATEFVLVDDDALRQEIARLTAERDAYVQHFKSRADDGYETPFDELTQRLAQAEQERGQLRRALQACVTVMCEVNCFHPPTDPVIQQAQELLK